MNISNHFLQKYYPTRKLYVWALALIYIAPISLLAAQQTKEEQIKIFIKEDLETLASKNKQITQNDLKSTWAIAKLNETKSNSLNDLIKALKKDHAFIINAASTLLIKQGHNKDTRKQLNLLTEGGIGLIKKIDLELDKLTLKTLAGFYDNKDNIKFITAILQAQKKTVTEKIMEELKELSWNWVYFRSLLKYDNKEGIPALGLSYDTVDIPFELLVDKREKPPCRWSPCQRAIKDIVQKQPEKGIKFIENALKALNQNTDNLKEKENIWWFLDFLIVDKDGPKVAIHDDKATEAFKAFTVEKYLQAVSSLKDDDINMMVRVTKKIVENRFRATQFINKAFKILKNSENNNSDLGRSFYIWEIFSKLVENHKDIELKLQELPYSGLSWHSKFHPTLKQLLNNNPKTAQSVAKKAFQDDNSQKLEYFWSFLSFLITDPEGPKVDATQIDATNMTLNTALDGAKKKPKLLMKILKEGPEENRARALTLVNKAFQDVTFQKKNFFWNLLDCLITDEKGPKVNVTQIDATKMTLKTALDGVFYYSDTLMKILKKDKITPLKFVNEAFQDDKFQNKLSFWRLLDCLITDEKGPKIAATQIDATKMTLETALDGATRYSNTLMKILKEGPEKNKDRALTLLQEAFTGNNQNSNEFWNLVHCLIVHKDELKIEAQQIKFEKFKVNSVYEAFFSKRIENDVIESVLRSYPDQAKKLVKEILSNQNLFSKQNIEELLHWLIFDSNTNNQGAIVPLAKIDITIEAAVQIFHYLLQNQPNPKLSKILNNVLRNKSLQGEAEKKVKDILNDNTELSKLANIELLHWLIFDSHTNNQDAIVPPAKIDITIEAAVAIFHYLLQNQPNPKLSEILNNVLRNNSLQGEAEKKVKDILNDNTELSKPANIELLYWLIFDSHTNSQDAIVPPAKIDITIEAAVGIFHYLQSQPNPKLSEILNNVLRNNPLQGEAEKKVKDILSNDTELNKLANIELLYWLIFDSHTNNQDAIVPPAKIDITIEAAVAIFHYLLQNQPNPKLSEILNNVIETQPSIGKGMLEIAINGQTGSPLNWSNTNVDFDLLYLLMLDPNGPQLTIEGADLASLDLSAIEIHISKPNALQLFKKILHDANNIDTFNAFRYAIFPSNSNSSSTFDYQNVDWDTTKWGSIPALKELIKPIDLPEDIVVKKLQDDGFTHKAIVRDIVLASSSNLLEKVLNIAFPNVTVTSTTPTPTIAWPQSLSETNWDIVASLTNSKYGIIKAKEVIQKVIPGISSSEAHFARNYNLSSVRWEDFDWEAFEGLAEQSNIANFSIQNYLTIAENVLPGLRFVDQEPEVSQIHWDQIKSYKVVNFLIKKEIIPKKILINAPRSLLKQRINNVARLSLAEANFWKNTQEEKSKYYWSFAPYAVGLVLASAIVLLYIFNKQEKKKGSHNEEAKVQTQHNINNKQFHKIRSR